MLSKLLNKRFNCISRAMDMLCLFLGEDYSFVSENGDRIDVAEYSIHFQTQWRFRKNRTILLASQDIYEPFDENVPDDWEYDIVGRSNDMSSVFDVYAKQFMLKMQSAVVKEASLSPTNDICIKFSNGVVFEQFSFSSRKEEMWRLIDYKNNTHTVCYDEQGNISCN